MCDWEGGRKKEYFQNDTGEGFDDPGVMPVNSNTAKRDYNKAVN